MWLIRKIAKYGRPLPMLLVRFLAFPFGIGKIYKSSPTIDEPAGPQPSPATINIDAATVLGEIHPYIYGGFIEVLGKCVYEGVWDEHNPNVPLFHGGLRQDVLDELRALNLPIIRWPGGCFSDVYHWTEGIGPRNQRRSQRNKYWGWFGPKIGARHDNHFGMDEFMLFIGELGSDPYININFGSGTPEEAAQWVEYANGDETTKYGALRATNGHPEPYDVKIWGIANEIYGFHEEGWCSAEEYGHRYIEFAKAMRAVDPSIKLVAVGTDFLNPKWNRTLLEIAGDYIDYLSLHIYIPFGIFKAFSNNVKEFYGIVSGAFEFERRIKWVEESIIEVMGENKKIPIALDEWGPWWNFRQLFEGYYTLRDGMFAASVFEILHQNVDAVKMANYAQLVNVLPLLVTNSTDVYHNPIYLAFQLFSNHAERFVISSSVTCESRTNPKFGIISETEIPYLGCSATINQAKDQLVVIGINRHHAHDLPTTISLNNFNPNSLAQLYELNGPSHSAFNDFNKKDEVKIVSKEFSAVSKQFNYTFPAHSVTALILSKKK